VRGERAPPGVVNVFDHRGRFFQVLHETKRSQTAVMTIPPGADSGPEEEHHGDQVLYVIEGEAVVRVADREHRAGPGSLVTVPRGVRHHVSNPASTPLLLLTVYAPPEY
jgi:mannose-6-phosphate isomerase-like protein (cupin superfamily)